MMVYCSPKQSLVADRIVAVMALVYLRCSVPMFCGPACNFIYEGMLGDYA